MTVKACENCVDGLDDERSQSTRGLLAMPFHDSPKARAVAFDR